MKAFSLTACLLNIGGVPISGFADGEALTFDEVPQFEILTGSDGMSVACFKAHNHIGATLRLMQHSKAYMMLMLVLEAQRLLAKTTGILTPLPFSYTDPSTGTNITGAYCVFMTIPGFSVGEQPGPIEFKLTIGTFLSVRGALNLV